MASRTGIRESAADRTGRASRVDFAISGTSLLKRIPVSGVRGGVRFQSAFFLKIKYPAKRFSRPQVVTDRGMKISRPANKADRERLKTGTLIPDTHANGGSRHA